MVSETPSLASKTHILFEIYDKIHVQHFIQVNKQSNLY